MAADHHAFPLWLQKIASPGGVGAVFVIYGFLHGLAARLSGPALALDDVKLNVVAQSWAAGYLTENPPLYEYLLILSQSVAGPTLISFLIVKYALLTASGVFAFLIAREAGSGRPWAAATAFSMILLYQIGWNYHQAFTHTMALIAATLFFWWAFFRFLRGGGGTAALLGAAVGLGLLAKYSFAAALAAAFIAGALNAPARRALISPRIMAAVAVAAIIVAPHLYWLASQNEGVAAAAASRLQGAGASHFSRAVAGLPVAAFAMASFFLPFALIAGAIFRPHGADLAPRSGAERLLRDAGGVGAAGLMLAVVAVGIPSLQERYVIAFLLPSYFWLMARLEAGAARPGRQSLFFGAIGAAAGSMFLLRIIQASVPGAPFCSDCRQWIPYDAVAKSLDAAGFSGGTLVGFTDHTAGNLRRLYPDARVLSAHLPFYTPPGGRLRDDCWFVWSEDLGPPAPTAVTDRFDPETTYNVVGEWRHFAREAGWRRTRWTVAKVDHDASLEKALCRPAD